MTSRRFRSFRALAGASILSVVTTAAAAVVEELEPGAISAAASGSVPAPGGPRLPPGHFLVGAARASLDPAPGHFGGTAWQTTGCTTYGDPGIGHVEGDHLLPDPVDPAAPSSALAALRGWPAASPDCIYLGGFGLGPARPASRVGHGGMWVRAIAVSNGEATQIYAVADTVAWFSRYEPSVCEGCGVLDVRERLAAEVLGDAAKLGHVIVGATHTHAGPDTMGSSGGIPAWYRRQLADAAVAAGKQAVRNLRPARIEVGEVHLRRANVERRDTYYSTADTGASWLQARECGSPACDGAGDVIATWATYAAHPTIVSAAILHADWPGATARVLERRFGGVGIVFEGGLGNVSAVRLEGTPDLIGLSGTRADLSEAQKNEVDAEAIGLRIGGWIADDVAKGVNGTLLATNEMRAEPRTVTHPTMSNAAVVTLGSVGIFDRESTPGSKGAGYPGEYSWSKNGETSTSGEDNDLSFDAGGNGSVGLRSCVAAGPTILTTAGANRIGEAIVAYAPGEIFSTISEVVKERASESAVTIVLGQANDSIGYIIQDFEFDDLANAPNEYVVRAGEYEEVFAVDRCIGDHVLETMLEATRALGAGG